MKSIKASAALVVLTVLLLVVGCTVKPRPLKKGEYLKCPSCGYEFPASQGIQK